jgi:hypothetical protein
MVALEKLVVLAGNLAMLQLHNLEEDQWCYIWGAFLYLQTSLLCYHVYLTST